MKKMGLLFALLICSSSFAIAGEGSGYITRLYVHEKNADYGASSGVVMFSVTNHTNPPSECSGHEWALSLATETGRAMYSLLLSAAAQKSQVVVKGAGDCAAWNDRERPYYIYIDY